MSDLILTDIAIYPVKSLGGIHLQSSIADERGLQYDRRWMLIDTENTFVSQRECAEMTLIGTRFTEKGFELFHKYKNSSFEIPFSIEEGKSIDVKIWDDTCPALQYNQEADRWLSDQLEINCRLVYMPDFSRRLVDPDFAIDDDVVSFADGYPFHIIGESTLDDLNNRMEKDIPMNRFRPNFVFSGGKAFEEDEWKKFKINDAKFFGVKLCGRCVIPTIDQETAEKSNEPLRTLNQFRKKGNRILFGQYLLLGNTGLVSVGDNIYVEEYLSAEK